MKRSVVFATAHLAPLPALARLAEDAGFHRAWTTEYPGRDALLRCALIGAATSTLQLGTGIAYSFARHPLSLAAAALDLHEATGGRFALGLGAGTRGMRGRWFGLAEERPVARMREAVEVVRAVEAAAGAVSYRGDFYSVEVTGLDNRTRLAGLPPLRVFGSGLNAAMTAAAAEWTDGLLLHPLAAGPYGRAPGPAGPDRWLSQWVITAVTPDGDRARRLARRALAFYLSTPSYARHFAGSPWADVPAAVAARFREVGPDWDALGDGVPDGMVAEHCVAGTPAEARAQLDRLEAALAAGGVAEVTLQVAVTDLDETATAELLTGALKGLAPR